MEARFLAQAKGRLKLCHRALVTLRKGETLLDETEFQIHWVDFLVQWKGVYMKLQQAAKSSPQERQWFGALNNERRNDPLLRWLYEARNDEEHHGLIESAIRKPESHVYRLLKNGPISGRIDMGNPGVILDMEGEIVAVRVSHEPEVSMLQEVVEKDGKKKVPAPTSHLGRSMPPHPILAALLGLRWIAAALAKAESMSTPSQ